MGNVTQNNGMVGNGSDLFIGYPMQMFYGYKTDGVFLTDDEVGDWYDQTAIAKGSKAGDIRYVDITGDGKVTPDDKTFLGSRIPKYTFGLNFGGEYKGFDFSVLLQGCLFMQVMHSIRRVIFRNGKWRIAGMCSRITVILNILAWRLCQMQVAIIH